MTDPKRNNRISPKDDFIAYGPSGTFTETMTKPEMRRAAETAFAQFCYEQANDDPRSALKISGAREFLNVFMNLGHSKLGHIDPKLEELIPV